MRKTYATLAGIMTLTGCLILAFAQAPSGDRVAVAFTDPSRPGTLKANLVNGGITVKGYDGKVVVVEARPRSGGRGSSSSDGMRRITMSATGLAVDEENNVMRVQADSHQRAVDLTMQVPRQTSLNLHCVNDGDIVVEGVEGQLEVNDINGAVTLKNVSGSAVAHALNGKVLVNFVRVDGSKPMSFSSLNGDIDVTFPADLKANLKMQSDRGEILSDFEVQMREPGQRQIVEDSRNKNGRYRVRVDKTIYGTINGGGPEIQFKNFNGTIYIRKGK